MNRYIFAVRNVTDKLSKIAKKPSLVNFYFQSYLFSKVKNRDVDVFFISYPKCGRTWLRFLLSKYIAYTSPEIEQFSDKLCLKLNDGRIVKFDHDLGNWVPKPTHPERMLFNESKYSGRKVVFLVRDPRDVLVSSWYHLRFRENIYRKSLSEFIRDDLLGINKVVSFMNMWIKHSHLIERFFLLSYEQLSQNTVDCFTELLEFLDVNIDSTAVEKTISESTFSKMKQIELKGNAFEPWMRIGKNHSADSMKIRKGKMGGYKDELTGEDIEYLNKVISERLSDQLPYRY